MKWEASIIPVSSRKPSAISEPIPKRWAISRILSGWAGSSRITGTTVKASMIWPPRKNAIATT